MGAGSRLHFAIAYQLIGHAKVINLSNGAYGLHRVPRVLNSDSFFLILLFTYHAQCHTRASKGTTVDSTKQHQDTSSTRSTSVGRKYLKVLFISMAILFISMAPSVHFNALLELCLSCVWAYLGIEMNTDLKHRFHFKVHFKGHPRAFQR